MTDNLTSLLTTKLHVLESELAAASDSDWHDAVAMAEPPNTGILCQFEASFDQLGDQPPIELDAHVLPGGDVCEARLKATEGDVSATVDIEPGTKLHDAVQVWFTHLWDTWDEVPSDASGEAYEVRASDLLPGDRLVRLGLTVVSVESDGITSAGEPAVVARYSETTGTDRWPACRGFVVIRDTEDDDARAE